MEKWTFVLLALVGVLFVGQVIYNESFVDASDNSGSKITLSLTELLSLIGTSSSSSGTTSTTQPVVVVPTPQTSYDSQFSSLKDAILADVRSTVRDQMASSSFGAAGGDCANVMDDTCIESMANLQGSEFMKYIPGKNPADFIRKDSVPCYGCSIPT
jgi:hypothetical protein